MCEPTTIAIVAAASAIAAGGVSAYGQVQEGKAQKEAANYNARIANIQADNRQQQGLEQEAQHSRKVAQLKSQQRAGMAANGIDLTSDTAMTILEQTAEWGERDRQMIEQNTNMDVWGMRSGASLLKAQGKNAQRAGYYGAGSTLLNSGADTLYMGKDLFSAE